MAKKNVKPTKTLTALDRLTDAVKQEFREIPTPGQIKAWLKEAKHKRVDYPTARNIQMRIKRAAGRKEGKPAPEKVSDAGNFKPQEPATTKPAGQMRHSTSHGSW